MTFDLLTDDKQTVITRSVLRAIVEPTPNLRIEATEELNPAVRIRDRDEAVEEATTEAQRENAELDGLVLDTGADTNVLEPPPLIDRTMDDFNPQELEQAFLRQMQQGGLQVRRLEEPPAMEPLFNDIAMDNDGIGAADLQILVDEPLPMHQRRQRKRKYGHEKPTRSPTQEKRKHPNIRSNKRHAPSNKKRTRKVKRLQQHEPSHSHSIERNQDDESQEFVIENILRHRRNKDNGTLEVLVTWEGYDSDEDTWEPASSIKETAAETLAKYAIDNGLSRKKEWKWTNKFDVKSSIVSTDAKLNSAPVEGGSKQSKRKRSSTRKSKANKLSSSKTKATFLDSLLNHFRFNSGDNGNNKALKNYIDFDDKGWEVEMPTPVLPLETVTFEHPTQDMSTNVDKILEIQEMDRYNDKEDLWTIEGTGSRD